MIYTAGHSNLNWEDFLLLIEPAELLIDVRSHPTSRHPQYRRDHLQRELGGRYQWWPQLGGWSERHSGLRVPGVDLVAYATGQFPKHHIAASTGAGPPDRPVWTNVGLLEYARFMATDEFLGAADRLLALAAPIDIVLVCCECLYYKCHRSMIADWLVWRGADAGHLILSGRRRRVSSHRRLLGNRLQRYSEPVLQSWRAHASLR